MAATLLITRTGCATAECTGGQVARNDPVSGNDGVRLDARPGGDNNADSAGRQLLIVYLKVAHNPMTCTGDRPTRSPR